MMKLNIKSHVIECLMNKIDDLKKMMLQISYSEKIRNQFFREESGSILLIMISS